MKTKAPPKLDLYKLHANEYQAPKKPVLLAIPPAQYLSIAGQGAPGGPRFEACIGALYGVAFTIKMTRKFAGQGDYAVAKLEGQWLLDRQQREAPKDQWQWQLMIRTPDFITARDREQAVAVLLKRGKPGEVAEVKLETVDEGQCVQMLHVGPYEKEGDTVALMQAFAEQQGFIFTGAHHDIYLSDPRRVPAERLRTILRHPVTAKPAK
jgi:hypothetical protein